jgi:AP-1 complex subunit beta-1
LRVLTALQVVANTVAALSDIHNAATAQLPDGGELSADDPACFTVSTATLNKLLIALNECSEWGRVAVLCALGRYRTVDEKESEHICERVVPQFQHANGAVVLAAVQAIMVHMRRVRREELLKVLVRKMAPPLVTLLSSPPEVQWVALRNVNLLLQKRPDLLSNEMRVFFCKYNDPLYVKVEKLDIMVRLASDANVDALLSELKECVFVSLSGSRADRARAGTRPRSTSTLCARRSARSARPPSRSTRRRSGA